VEKLGVYGGTFDPVHVGHLVAATEVRYQLGLDRVLLVPAGDPWQKHGEAVAGADDRLALVAAAVDGVEGLEASALEVQRDGPSITADTLEDLAASDRELFLILGADAVANMSTWKRLDDTKPLATVVVVEREGERAVPPGDGWRTEHVAIPRLDVSSTNLRERLRAGQPVDGLIPPAAVALVRSRRLYTAS
jgi:nicotinate-nucleotide adenylyltransferase